MPDGQFLQTEFDLDGEVTVLGCSGLTWKYTDAFRAAVVALPKTGDIVFDLRGERSDAAGTAAIICAVLDITAGARSVALLTGAGIETQVLRATGLGQLAPIASSLEEAKAAMRNRPAVTVVGE